jgi:hypothetical protein
LTKSAADFSDHASKTYSQFICRSYLIDNGICQSFYRYFDRQKNPHPEGGGEGLVPWPSYS